MGSSVLPAAAPPPVPPPASAPSAPSWAALGLAAAAAAVVAGPLALAAGGEGRVPLVALAGFAGVTALACVVAFAGAHAVVRLLYVAAAGLAFVPVEKHFRYVQHIGGWPGVRVGLSDLAFLPLVGIALAGWRMGRVRNAVPRPVLVLYALFLGWYLLAAAGAPHHDLAAFELLGATHAILLVVVTAALYRREALGPLLVLTALAVLGHAAGGVAEYVLKHPIGPRAADQTAVQEVLEGGAHMRPSGLFIHPIVLADFFLMTLPMLGAALLASGRLWQRAALSVALLAGLGVLGLTLSRGAWASTVLAAALLVALAAREGLLDASARRTLRRVAAVCAVASLGFAPVVYQRLTNSNPGNVRVRFDLNEIALRMVADHPLTGTGLNNFVQVMQAYDPKDVYSYFPGPAHNLYLLEAAESGIPAALLFIGVTVALLVTATARLRRVRHVADPLTRWVAAALIASLAGLAVSQIADFSWRLEPLRTLVWVQVGLLFGMLGPGVAATVVAPTAATAAPRPAPLPEDPS